MHLALSVWDSASACEESELFVVGALDETHGLDTNYSDDYACESDTHTT
jgi:hypothetical protein